MNRDLLKELRLEPYTNTQGAAYVRITHVPSGKWVAGPFNEEPELIQWLLCKVTPMQCSKLLLKDRETKD